MRKIVVVMALLIACGHSGHAARLPVLVPEAATSFDSITVSGVPASPDVARSLAPLQAAKQIVPEAGLAEYGLDRPAATIEYTRRGEVVHRILVGTLTFDAHAFYVGRPGDPEVYLVLAATLRPALQLVGVPTPPST